jgi:predicted nucleotidyltransferase
VDDRTRGSSFGSAYTQGMEFRSDIDRICREHGLLSVYLFGSRADDGRRLLEGETVARAGSDLDVGLVFLGPEFDVWELSKLQVLFEDLFAPLRVDLVPLQKVDPIFQFRAIDGHCIAETDSTRNAYFELDVMRSAAELLPIQRRIERDLFGASTT